MVFPDERARLVLPLLAVLIALTGCAPREAELGGQTMGTTWSVRLVDSPVPSAELQVRLERELERVNALMSTYDSGSELMRFNGAPVQEPFAVDDDTRDVVELALDISRLSEGGFDVTVGPLVNLWGFGPGQRPEQVPDPAAIARARQTVGYDRLRVEGNALVREAGLFVDLSAIAKGHAVDVLARTLEAAGVTRYLVEIGGELRGAGKSAADRPWRVAVEAPVAHTREIYRVVPLQDMGLATSGDYRNYFEDNGQRFSHMIDPRSGRPITHNVASVSVLHTSVAYADGWATALNVLGFESGMAVATREGIRALFILRIDGSFKAHPSPALEAYLLQSPQ